MKTGKRFDFHGSYTDKAAAVAKERETGGFIREREVSGKMRYFVLTKKGKNEDDSTDHQ